MTLLSRLAKGASITFVGMFISKFMGFFYRITVGRGLGPEAYGYLTLGIASFFLAQNLANISVDEAITRYVPEDYSQTSKYLFSALRVSVPLGIVSGFAMFIFAEQFVNLVGFDPAMVEVVRIMAVAVPFGVASSSLNNVFVAREKLRFNVYINNIYQQAFKLFSGVAALALGLGLSGVTWGFTLSAITSMFLSIYYLKTRFDLSWPEDTNSRKIVKYSWPLFFSGLMGFVLSWTDTVMIGFFTGSGSKVGIYNAAFPLAQTLTIFMGATTTIAFPIMSGLYADKKLKELSNFYKSNTRWVLTFTTPAFLLMFLFPEEIIHLSFGSEYTSAAYALRILGGGFFLGSLVGPTGQLLKSTDNQKYIMYNSVASTTVNVAMNLVLIPMMGIAGAAYASIASSLIGNIAGAVENYYEEGIHSLHTGLLPLFSASILSLVITYIGIKTFQPVTPLWTLIPGAAVFGTLYLIFLVLFGGIKEEDRDIIKGAGRRVGMEEEADKIADIIIRE
jgi:O-antigen/teichoic acid export membrane protein